MHFDERQQYVLARGEVRKEVVCLENGADAAAVREQVDFVECDFAAVDGEAATLDAEIHDGSDITVVRGEDGASPEVRHTPVDISIMPAVISGTTLPGRSRRAIRRSMSSA